jgi:unsaturated chondroitin disaccharide hydrolase
MIEALESRQLMAGTGLQAVYYNNANLTGTNASRIDSKVYFDFTKSPPPASIERSTYSVRWTGFVRPTVSGSYTFYTKSDDGIRLWVNHKLLIDHWKPHALTEAASVVPVTLNAGKNYEITLEYFNNSGAAAAQLWWSSASIPKSVVPTARLYPRAQNVKDRIDHAFGFAEQQYLNALANIKDPNLSGYAATNKTTWDTTGPEAWTSGFFAGSLWQIYAHNTKKAYRLNATTWTRPIGPFSANHDDIGFRIWNSYFPMAGSTKLAADKQVLKDAANAKLAVWNPNVGMFRTAAPGVSLGNNASGNFMVIIDQAMDMEPLWWAWKETGITTYRDRAIAHLTKLAQTFVREDGSTLQIGFYNDTTGNFVGPDVKQGLSTISTWSRGQGWAIHSYTTAYAQTGNPVFLEIAKKVSDYWLANIPADGIPYWDFGAPGQQRDSTAAAIAASGFAELARVAPDLADKVKYKAAAERTLNGLLSAGYFAEGKPSPGLLLHGAHWVSKSAYPDSTLVYGDFYLLQAMNRYLALG